MKIEYVTACINYSDFLKVSYTFNKGQFDHYIVVTDFKDERTASFCRENGITLVQTNDFYKNGALFDRGGAYNRGLEHLKYHDFVCMVDADTFVPPTFHKDIENLNLNKEFFYGAFRVLLKTPEDVKRYMAGAKDEEFEIPEGFGYGWFQMFNWQSEVIKKSTPGVWYPSYYNCCESDWMFRAKWGTFEGSHAKWSGNFDKLPFNTYNLGQHGIDHFGRKSKEFVL